MVQRRACAQAALLRSRPENFAGAIGEEGFLSSAAVKLAEYKLRVASSPCAPTKREPDLKDKTNAEAHRLERKTQIPGHSFRAPGSKHA